VLVVNRFPCILFKVKAGNANLLARAIGKINLHHAFPHNRVQKLRDLIALGKVRIKIVFTLKNRAIVDLGIEAKASSHSLFHAVFVENREHPGHGRVNKGDVRVRGPAKFT
jgi:hypothetical protein